jgi:hypothetical protein
MRFELQVGLAFQCSGSCFYHGAHVLNIYPELLDMVFIYANNLIAGLLTLTLNRTPGTRKLSVSMFLLSLYRCVEPFIAYRMGLHGP